MLGILLCIGMACIAGGLMLATGTYNTKVVEDGYTSSIPYSGNFKTILNFAITSGTTNAEHDVAFTRANLQLLWIISDQNITLKTNSTSSPDNTFSLLAGVPLVIAADGYWAATVFLAADVTKFYWTNASGVTANIKGEVIYN